MASKFLAHNVDTALRIQFPNVIDEFLKSLGVGFPKAYQVAADKLNIHADTIVNWHVRGVLPETAYFICVLEHLNKIVTFDDNYGAVICDKDSTIGTNDNSRMSISQIEKQE